MTTVPPIMEPEVGEALVIVRANVVGAADTVMYPTLLRLTRGTYDPAKRIGFEFNVGRTHTILLVTRATSAQFEPA